MQPMQKGRYLLDLAQGDNCLRESQRLRALAFFGRGPDDGATLPSPPVTMDADDLDARCQHVLIRDVASGQLVGCFRMMLLPGGAQIGASYSARFYNLARLRAYQRPMLEIGRFCLHPDWHDPDILRLAWGGLARYIDQAGIGMLFGCSSFRGVQVEGYEDAFAMLRERHLAPKRWLPRIKAPQVFRFGRALRQGRSDPKRAMLSMPPLLRSYLMMGGWVSDHAVVDRQMNSLHVFTGLEVSAIPPVRASLLRAVAG